VVTGTATQSFQLGRSLYNAHVNDACLHVSLCKLWRRKSPHVGDMGHHTPSIYQDWRPSRSKKWLIFGHDVKWPGDLDFGTGVECQTWHGQPSCQFLFLRLFIVKLWASMQHNDDTQSWPLTSMRMLVVQVVVVWNSSVFSCGRYGTFSVAALIGLDTLTFRPLNVSRVFGFLPANFQLVMPFHSWLRVRHGTDRWRPSTPYASP